MADRAAQRDAAEEMLTDFEQRLEEAVQAAIRLWLAEIRRRVLDNAVTAAALMDALTSAGEPPPNLGGFNSGDSVWRLALRSLLGLIGDMFGEAFLAFSRRSIVSAQPWREVVIEEVESRLKLFPAEQFEEIRFEIAEAISEGEPIDQIRDRIGAVLDFDTTAGADGEQAETRELQGRINELEKVLDDPENGLDDAEIRALRSQRGELYEALYKAKGGWEWKARRIARTEAALTLNGGTYYAAVAETEVTGETLWKQWLSSADTRTRPTHVVADGQVRLLKDEFTVGGFNLLFPADPKGPGHETINCRCTLLLLDRDDLDDEDIDPENLPEGTPPPESEDSASAQADALPASAELPATDPALGETMDEPNILPDGWRGILAPLDVRSGDGRIIATPAALRVRQAPRALLWQPTLEDYHGGAVMVGRIDRVWIDGGNLMGEGPFDLVSEHGAEAARQLGGGFSNGVSVDLDDMIMTEVWFAEDGTQIPEGEDTDWDALWEAGARPGSVATDWRLMTATLVTQPAFDEARLQPVYGYVPDADADPVPGAPADGGGATDTASVRLPSTWALSLMGDTGLPVASDDPAWDAAGAMERVTAMFTDADGVVDPAGLAQAALWLDSGADPVDPAAYRLWFADVVDDTLTIIPEAVAALGVDATVPDVEEEDQAVINAAVCDLYATVTAVLADWDPCPYAPAEDGEEDAPMVEVVAASARTRARRWPTLTAAAATAPMPAGAFANPGLSGPTALTVTDDGRIFGHLATWGVCHVGFPDVCVTPPKSATGYALFHVGEVITDAGPVPVGKITLGTGHAPARAGARPAAEHYDNSGTCVAVVQAGDDEHGIWVAGQLLDDVTPAQVAELRRSPLSGDWRRVNGNLELVAALAVNVPGFPVPRILAASGAAGQQLSLCAAGAVPQPRPSTRPPRTDGIVGEPLDYARLSRMIVAEQRRATARYSRVKALERRLGVDNDSRARALEARIKAGGGAG